MCVVYLWRVSVEVTGFLSTFLVWCLRPATSLFKMLLKYRPEDKAAKKERLLNKAKAEAEGKTLESKKPIVVKYGINHVTYLIEQVAVAYFSFKFNTIIGIGCHLHSSQQYCKLYCQTQRVMQPGAG